MQSEECKNSNIQNCNCAWCSLLVRNVVFAMREKHRLQAVLEYGAEKDIWAYEGRAVRALEKTASSPKYSADKIKKNEMSGSCSTHM